ncbi:FtsX-like permease family protein, partial [Candidatus Bathyarchaeota archaeon]
MIRGVGILRTSEHSNAVGGPFKAALMLLLVGVLLSNLLLCMPAHAQSYVTGTVVDEDGVPVEGAKASLWFGRKHFTSDYTDSEGFFELEYYGTTGYNISIYSDDPSTPGVDYLPAWMQFNDLKEPGAVVTLRPGASLLLEGDVQFVVSNSLPEDLLYTVLEPDSGEPMTQYGVPILYGSHERGQNFFLDLEPNHVVVPAGEPFLLEVNSSIPDVAGMAVYSFDVDEYRDGALGVGELASLDIRPYSIGFNLGLVSSLMDEVNASIDYMREKGFYMVKERSTAEDAEGAYVDAQSLLAAGRFVESFGFSKMSYIDLAQVRDRLIGMQADATSSVYIIVAFLALASTTIAFLLTNNDSTKIVASAAVYAGFLAVLYTAYPGSVLVPFTDFMRTGLLSIAGSLFLALLLPRWMKGGSRRGMVPLRNILVPIFSMAKRSIRRRRLRFLLTLISITVLVMSFVTLTSFSETKDLLVRRISPTPAPVRGVLLRSGGYSFETPEFMTEGGVNLEWLLRQPEVAQASQRAENLPSIRHVTTLNGVRIYGVVGFDSALEDEVLGISSVIEEGALPSEGGVVISEELRDALDVEVGDTLLLGGTELVLEGVFDDAALWALRDLDGESYLPGKEENMNPPEERPMYHTIRCETDEIVLLGLTTAMELPLVRVSRVDVSVNEGVDVRGFAERLALERGYWAWSSSDSGLHVALMGSYLEGKGLPLMVPWAIVVLNVVVTMLNSMYERRKEIHILSSVGLNPAQIATIFVAEASIIG